MHLFADRISSLRDEYILPLIHYKIKHSESEYKTLSLKNVVCTRFHSVTEVTTKKFILEYDNDELFRSLILDFEQFYTHTFLQHINLFQTSKSLSPNWAITSNYYLNFFSSTTLLRMLHQGWIYLDDNKINEFASILEVFLGHSVSLNSGHYFFEIKLDQIYNKYFVELSTGKKRTHEDVWNKVFNLFKSLQSKGKKDDEYIVVKTIYEVLLKTKSNLPSQVRNKINYSSEYGLKSLRNEIYYFETDSMSQEDFFQAIIKFDDASSIQEQVNFTILYGKYIHMIMNQLYSEYINRSPLSNRSLFSERRKYLDALNKKNIRKISLPYY